MSDTYHYQWVDYLSRLMELNCTLSLLEGGGGWPVFSSVCFPFFKFHSDLPERERGVRIIYIMTFQLFCLRICVWLNIYMTPLLVFFSYDPPPPPPVVVNWWMLILLFLLLVLISFFLVWIFFGAYIPFKSLYIDDIDIISCLCWNIQFFLRWNIYWFLHIIIPPFVF